MPPTQAMRDWLTGIPGANDLSVLLTADGPDAKPSDEIAKVFKAGKVLAAVTPPGMREDTPLKDKRKAWEQKAKDLQKDVDEAKKAIEKMVDDPVGFAKTMRDKGLTPIYDTYYSKDTDETRFLDDLKTGTKQAQEYINYIHEAAKYAKEFGDITQLKKAQDVAARLDGIYKKINGPLDKFRKKVDQVKEVVEWYEAASDFAKATRKLEFKGTRISRNSVKAWVGSIKDLAKASEPFSNWVGDKLTGAASAAFSIIAAQLKLGLAALEAGVAVVSAYLDRYEDIMKEIDRQAHGWGDKPKPPSEPPAWESREERAGKARVADMMNLTAKVNGEQDYAKRQAKEAREEEIKEARAAYDRQHQKFIDEFEAKLFPRIYLDHRPELRKKIQQLERKQRARKPTQTTPEEETPFSGKRDWDKISGQVAANLWENCLVGIDPPPDEGFPSKPKVTLKEAEFEIQNFKGVKPPFPDFVKLHQTSLDQHLAKVAKPFEPPPE